MILSDREIKAALERGPIRITPDPRSETYLWRSTALDLRLGEQLAFWDLSVAGAPLHFSPADPTHALADLIAQFVLSSPIPPPGTSIVPGKFYLGWTLAIILKPGMPICQLIFEQVDGTPEQGYAGQFAIQGPAS